MNKEIDMQLATDFRSRTAFTRHGGAYDRGSADSFYWREANPHYFTSDTYNSTKIELEDMSEEEIAAYMAGYNETTDRKDWGTE